MDYFFKMLFQWGLNGKFRFRYVDFDIKTKFLGFGRTTCEVLKGSIYEPFILRDSKASLGR